jgi:hypothetical protein
MVSCPHSVNLYGICGIDKTYPYQDPIIGERFTSSNVADVDICGACVSAPGQTFTASGKAFAELTWAIVAEPSDEPSYVEKAGMGATGRYLKNAPNANEFADDKDFRGAMLARELEKRQERRASGKPMGNAAANSYMNFLIEPPEPVAED